MKFFLKTQQKRYISFIYGKITALNIVVGDVLYQYQNKNCAKWPLNDDKKSYRKRGKSLGKRGYTLKFLEKFNLPHLIHFLA